MAEGKSHSPRMRLPKISLPTRAGKKPAAPQSGPSAKATATQDAPTQSAPRGNAPAPDTQERMEGLQGWMAEIERKQGRITYFGAAALLIAILASGAALYFGITAKSDTDSVNDDLDALQEKVDSLEQAVTKNTQDTQQTLNQTVSGLQTSIQDLQTKQAQDAANIATLQSQVAAGAAAAAGAGAGTGAGAGAGATPGTVTPGTTPKP